MMAETREKFIQNDILRTFGTKPTLRLWRANVGASTFLGPHGKQRVQFGVPGQADLSGIILDPNTGQGVRLEIEVKSAVGRQRPEQANYQKMIEKFGGIYILARSVEDVFKALTAKGYTI
jgi:hypothetical protein